MAAFTDRLGLKVTALVLAVVLWVIVSARERTEGLVRVRVIPVLDASATLADSLAPIRVQVYGRVMDIVKLYADPPVMTLLVHNARTDTLVRDVGPADIRLPSDVNGEVHVLDVVPGSLVVHLARKPQP